MSKFEVFNPGPNPSKYQLDRITLTIPSKGKIEVISQKVAEAIVRDSIGLSGQNLEFHKDGVKQTVNQVPDPVK